MNFEYLATVFNSTIVLMTPILFVTTCRRYLFQNRRIQYWIGRHYVRLRVCWYGHEFLYA